MPFGLWNKKVQVTIDRQKQVDINYATRQLEQGNLSFILGSNVNLAAGDPGRPVLSLHDVVLLEPEDISENSGIKKVVKGLHSFGHVQKEQGSVEKLAEIDTGTMNLMVDGIEFAGEIEQLRLDFDSIDFVEHTHNEVVVSVKNPERKLHFRGLEKTSVPLKVQDRLYDQPLSGKVLQLVIKSLLTKVSLPRG